MTITSLAFALPIMSLLLLLRAGAVDYNPNPPCAPNGISDLTGTCTNGHLSLTYSAGCNPDTIPDENSFLGTVGTLLGYLGDPTVTPYKTSIGGSGGSPTAYGEANCTALSATASDCTGCLTALTQSVLTICTESVGAQMYTDLCSIRYEQYDF